jgi:hypothetical protein
MTDCEREIVEIFQRLSNESQSNLLAFARLAHIAESAVKKSRRARSPDVLESETED